MTLARAIPIRWIAAAAAAAVAGPGAAGCGDGTGEDGASGRTVAPPPETPGLVVGIGEQGTGMFADPRFRALRIRHARLVAAYDAVAVRFERDLVDTWLAEARRAGVEPFVTFGHSRVKPDRLPTVAEFRDAFAAFRERYPDVRVYAAWNEINHNSQPTDDNPRRAAEYYNVVRAGCEECTVLAGDLLDEPDMERYLATYRRHLDGSPRTWGLHNYSDTNRFRRRGLRSLLRAVDGDVWLTETGGIVRFGRNFPHSERRAARALRYALRLARSSDRVRRMYIYNWTGAPRDARFDAGLVDPDRPSRRGAPRPAYEVLRAALRR